MWDHDDYTYWQEIGALGDVAGLTGIERDALGYDPDKHTDPATNPVGIDPNQRTRTTITLVCLVCDQWQRIDNRYPNAPVWKEDTTGIPTRWDVVMGWYDRGERTVVAACRACQVRDGSPLTLQRMVNRGMIARPDGGWQVWDDARKQTDP